MFKFKAEQKVYTIGGVKIGGQAGVNPPVIYGSIFGEGQEKLVTDHKKGVFDRKKAERIIKRQEELSDRTGCPDALDVVVIYAGAVPSYLDFLEKVTDAPLNVGSMTSEIRMAVARYVSEVGLINRVTCGPISLETKKEELEVFEEEKIPFVELSLFNKADPTSHGRVKMWRKLWKRIKDLPFKGYLLDTAVLDMPSIAQSSLSVLEVKDKLGYPVGCAPDNGIAIWKSMMAKKGTNEYMNAASLATAIPILYGADWIVYNIDHLEWVFPACALASGIFAYGARELGTKPSPEHALYRIFK
jgi:tetrahydromethanopterin S-methyltransferase subunit H